MESQKRIFVIDDADEVRSAVTRMLRQLGYEVHGAGGGVEGVAAIQANPPDLVLCDLRMPQLDGLGVLQLLRERSPSLPVVVMSGEGLLDDAINALRLGAWDYISKPVSKAVLQHTIGNALEKAALIRENKRQREKLEALYAELAEDEEAGRRLQLGLLPENGRKLGSFTLTRELLPSAYLSGDFLDAFVLDSQRWGFYLADVAGHGVPSALVTVMLRTLVERQVLAAHSGDAGVLAPSRFLSELNSALRRQGHDKHVALFYGLVDEGRSELRCANAGCFPWPVLIQHGKPIVMELPSMPLGMMSNGEYEERAYELAAEATLLASTDGVFEVMGPGTTAEKMQRIVDAARGAPTAAEFVRSLDLGSNPVRPDDVAVLMLKRGGPHALRTS